MKERYVKVSCILIQVTPMAVLIGIEDENGSIKQRWIPLSLVHGADELKLRQMNHIDKTSFRIMEWKAKELGL